MTEWKIGMRGRFPLGRWRTNGRTWPRMLWKKKRKAIFKYLLPRGEGKDKQMLTGCVWKHIGQQRHRNFGWENPKTSNPFRFLSVCVCGGESVFHGEQLFHHFAEICHFIQSEKKIPGSRVYVGWSVEEDRRRGSVKWNPTSKVRRLSFSLWSSSSWASQSIHPLGSRTDGSINHHQMFLSCCLQLFPLRQRRRK